MTTLQNITDLNHSADYEVLAQKYRPIFTKIAEGTVQREQDRILPFEQINWLKKSRFWSSPCTS